MKRATWTPEMDARLTVLYQDRSGKECASDLGVSLASAQNRVHVLGLSKSSEWKAERARKRWAEGRHEGSRRAHFRTGHAPQNKGRPQSEWMPDESRRRCAATQFKAGEMRGAAQHNYVPVGSLRITRDGQLQRKVTDDPDIYPAKRWVAVARLVWEAKRGPIPEGHVVRFRDGKQRHDPAEITADLLECITQAENMRRNSYHTNLPPEVARLVQLRGALNRKINNRTKQA